MVRPRLQSLCLLIAVTWLAIGIGYACPANPQVQANGGQCFDLNGTEIYANIQGEGHHPAVVFINGLGQNSTTWNQVIPSISTFAETISYDLPGLGQSPADPKLKIFTAQDNATLLHALLVQAKIQPPYIIVGHSLGGLYAQLFAQLYPKDVLGVALVDSSSMNEPEVHVHPNKNLPYYPEFVGFQQSRLQVKQARPFPPIPLIILTATKHASNVDESSWQLWQKEFLKLSPHAIQIIAWDSGHFIQKDQPNLVIDAVATMKQTP